MKIILFTFFFIFFLSNAHAEDLCKVPLTEISTGVYEVVFDEVRIKFEKYNNIAKMKLLGAFGIGDNWTSVKTDITLPSRISGYRKKSGQEHLISDLVVKESDDEKFEWAFFIATKVTDTQVFGMSYFASGDETRCISTTATKWVSARNKVFGKFFDISGVTVNKDVGF